MEDAHIALADIKCNFQDGNSSKINLFAVFDGHGGILYTIFYSLCLIMMLLLISITLLCTTVGKEVAKFAKLKYPELVLEQLIAHNGDVAVALRECFHRIDELLEEPVSSSERSGCGPLLCICALCYLLYCTVTNFTPAQMLLLTKF